MKEEITPKEQDFSQWYLDVISAADLAEHGPAKGTMIIKPYGYSIWENVQKYLDKKFKDTKVKNAYFPLFIPEHLLKKEEKHVEGFSPEVAVVTYAGGEKLEEPLIVRPTSETIMYPSFAKWIRSYRDLPLLINQWANVVRWEMRPRLFMRTTEFLWQEGHTAHADFEGADKRARQMLDVYADFAEKMLAIPVLKGMKTESEKFAGALHTYSLEAQMSDGKALQFATSHNLGQNFAKVFDVKYIDESNTSQYVWQTSWGLSTRVIGALIMVHSDDKGLVLPPNIASTKVVILPVWRDKDSESVLAYSKKLVDSFPPELKEHVLIDEDDKRLGEKHYKWEKKGVPIRIEVGAREVENNEFTLVRRDTGEKQTLAFGEIDQVADVLADIQKNLFESALEKRDGAMVEVDNWDDFKKAIEDGKFVSAHWSGDADDEAKIKEETKATIRVILFDQKIENGKCVFSGKPSKGRVIFAKAY